VSADVTLVEVGPRDGFQAVDPFIPTDRKIALIKALYAAGMRRIEVGSFVSATALPQMADAEAVWSAARDLPGLDPQVLAPTLRQVERAMAAGVDHVGFVLSVSEWHNLNNVRRTPLESVAEFARIVDVVPAGVRLRVNVATAFDCPETGLVEEVATLALLDALVGLRPDAEFTLCDTTGRARPDHVRSLFSRAQERFPQAASWTFHGHDTYGVGVANVLAAYEAGVRTFDASIAGLGGCPFAPGATGNVATEDVVWTFEGMGRRTGVDFDRLLPVAAEIVALPGAETGGRVRTAISRRDACRAA
jgi:hydroxymethylglutaryl-CoA lyase